MFSRCQPLQFWPSRVVFSRVFSRLKCSTEITFYHSMQNLCKRVRYSLLNSRKWLHVSRTVRRRTDRYTRYAVITIAIRLRYDYDPTTTYRARLLPFRAIRLRREKWAWLCGRVLHLHKLRCQLHKLCTTVHWKYPGAEIIRLDIRKCLVAGASPPTYVWELKSTQTLP